MSGKEATENGNWGQVFRVPGDTIFGLYSRENGEPVEVLSRDVTDLRSYISGRLAV